MIPSARRLSPSSSSALTVLTILVLGVGLSLLPATTWATGPEAQIADQLEQARDDYDMLFFEDAVDAIDRGLEIAETEEIRNDDVAQLHIILGLIRHADGDDELAVDAFVDAFETDPDVAVDDGYITPDVQELLAEADRRAEPPPVDEPDDEPEDDPEPPVAEDDPSPRIDDAPPEEEVDPLTHEPISRVDAGDELTVEAEIPADLPVFRVHVHHRRYGEEDFAELEMEPTDATGFSATIDGDQVRTSQIEYFITAIDRTGDFVAESGRTTDPHRISVIGDTDRTADDEPDDAPEAPDEPDDATGFFGSVFSGTDIGFLPGGTPPTANDDRDVAPGLSPAFAHMLVETGWRVSELNAVSMYFRWQFLPGQDFDRIRDEQGHPEHLSTDASFWEHRDECFGLGLPGDCMIGFKYHRTLSSDIPAVYSTVGAGIGRVRNWLRLKQATDEDDPHPACEGRDIQQDDELGDFCHLRDTVRTGWAHFGVGGGTHLPIPIHDSVDLDFVADSYLMIMVPDTSVNLDINIGLRYRH